SRRGRKVTNQTPPDSATNQTPPNSATNQTPPNSASNQTPPNSATNQTPPNSASNQTPPDSATNQTPPNSATNQTPPNSASNQTPPNSATNQTPPNSASNQTPPDSATNQTPPNSATNQTPPNSASNQTPPNSATNQTPPNSASNQKPPNSASNQTHPNSASNQTPPNSATNQTLTQCPDSSVCGSVGLGYPLQEFGFEVCSCLETWSGLKHATEIATMDDHDYGLAALPGASGDGESEVADIEIDEQMDKAEKINQAHTPIKSPHPKKYKKGNKNPQDDCIGEAILMAVNSLTEKMDTQTELLLKFERRIEENTAAIIENKALRPHHNCRPLGYHLPNSE
ncbi:hypothetical protein NFI96_031507, partial [Prochilodus magdalenae]